MVLWNTLEIISSNKTLHKGLFNGKTIRDKCAAEKFKSIHNWINPHLKEI